VNHLGLIELLGSGAIALGFGFYQLWSLRGHKTGTRSEPPRHPEREHRPDDR